MPIKYRKEIDGLRAIALLPVIFFHAGFEFFSGGYVGVDVFFVISGYLITSIILEEKKARNFSISNFYERRARRILPALFFISLCCIPLAWMWIPPEELNNFSQSLIAVSVFSSNIFFWQDRGYFSLAAELKPLLHTWSLAVEEQYYVLFPLILLLTWKFKLNALVILTATGLASLLLSQWSTVHYPDFSFYLLPTRLWELLLGSLTAFYLFAKSQNGSQHDLTIGGFHQGASALGLALILFSAFTYDRETPFPGLYALLPTLGTVLIIVFCSRQTFTGTLLGTRPLVFIGLISYSAYLWHQPLFAFARIRSKHEPSNEVMFFLSAGSFVLAYITWRYVEQPVRNKRRYTKAQIFQLAALGTTILLGIGIAGDLGDGFGSARYSPPQLDLLSFRRYDRIAAYKERECFLHPDQDYDDFGDRCFARAASPKTVLVWGDSHAAALASGIREMAGSLVQLTAAGCPPVIGAPIDGQPNCSGINDFVLAQIQRLRPKVVLVHADWRMYRNIDFPFRIAQTIEQIRERSPHSRVVVVGGVPQWAKSLPEVLLRHGADLTKASTVAAPMVPKLRSLDTKLKAAAVTHNAKFVSLLDHFCKENECLAVVQGESRFEPVAWDYGHLTKAGSSVAAKGIAKDMKNAEL